MDSRVRGNDEVVVPDRHPCENDLARPSSLRTQGPILTLRCALRTRRKMDSRVRGNDEVVHTVPGFRVRGNDGEVYTVPGFRVRGNDESVYAITRRLRKAYS